MAAVDVVPVVSRSARSWTLLVAALATSHCRATSEVVVLLDADDWASTHIEELEISGGVEPPVRTCARWPRVLGLAPETGGSDDFELDIRGLRGGNVIAEAVVAGTYRGSVELLRFTLTEACASAVCREDSGAEPPEVLEPTTTAADLAVADGAPPDVRVRFPPTGSIGIGAIHVTVEARNREGIDRVRIDDVDATAIDCAHFDVVHSPGIGTHALTAEASGPDGSASVRTDVHVVADDVQGGPYDLLFGPRDGSLYASTSRSIARIDEATGAWTPVVEGLRPKRLSRGPEETLFAADEFVFWVVDLSTGGVLPIDDLVGRVSAMAWDEARGRLLIGQNPDGPPAEILSFDPTTQAADPWVELPDAAFLVDLALDVDDDRLFATAHVGGRLVLLSFALATGQRTEHGCPGLATFEPETMVHLPATGRLLIHDRSGAIVEVDPDASACRVAVEAPQDGGPGTWAVAVRERTLWLAQPGRNRTIEIDLDTGERRPLPTLGVAPGPPLTDPWEVAFSPARHEAFVLANGTHELVAIDPDDGARRTVVRFEATLESVDVDDAGQLALVSTHAPEAVWEVELDTGTMRIVAGASSTPPLHHLRLVAYGEDRSAYFLHNEPEGGATLRWLDLDSGRQRVVATLETSPEAMAYDSTNRRLLVLVDMGVVLEFDVEDGDSTMVATGTPGIGRARAIEVAPDGIQAWVLYTRGIVRMDLLTGDRTIVSYDESDGPTPAITWGFDVDPRRRIAYVIDRELNGLFAVDLRTGGRVLMSL